MCGCRYVVAGGANGPEWSGVYAKVSHATSQYNHAMYGVLWSGVYTKVRQEAETEPRLHAARALVRGHQKTAGDALVFAVPHTLAFAFFPAWLGRLKAEFGEVPTRLIAGNVHDVVTMLVEGGCDLLLCYH
ncbi:MAG: LysR substrate-binding domain-containing protein, partial [Thauera sp.]